jgi:small redox-active disulfide protein 2
VEIRVFGPGCANCKRLEATTREALAALGQPQDVTKVEDLASMTAAGVLRTPALAIDDKLVLQGRVPGITELTRILERALAAKRPS